MKESVIGRARASGKAVSLSREEVARFVHFALDHLPDPAFWIDANARFLYANEAACRSLGYSRQKLLSLSLHDIDPFFDHEVWPARWRQAQQEGSLVFETRYRTSDGKLIPVEITSNFVEFEGKGYAFTTARDITERKQAETALRSAEEHYRELFENVKDVVFMLDHSGDIVGMNQAAESMFGHARDEALGMNFSRLVAMEQFSTLQDLLAAFSSGKDLPELCSFEIISDGGRRIRFQFIPRIIRKDGQPVGLLGIGQDVTEQKELAEQLRQAQKFEAIGRFVGGVAHDFNNLLTAIIGYSDLLREAVGPDNKALEDLLAIKQAGERASSLISQLLAFSRRQAPHPEVIDLNVLIADTQKMLRRLIEADVQLVTAPCPEPVHIKADPGQIEQVIMNLAVNARDAMPNGGTLTIETAKVELEEEYCRKHLMVDPGPYAVLAVTDTGCGMDPDTQAHIFEPFFTTKDRGKGTGLGLSTVDGIVQQDGGAIQVHSELGKGTTFRIYLPRVEEPVCETESRAQPHASFRGSETILIVEDEELVRVMARSVLKMQGYKVLEASNGEEALWLLENHHDRIHLIIADVVMPQMGGAELVEKVVPFHPETRVLFVSGYADSAVLNPADLGKRGIPFLQKPFTPELLSSKVREVLDASVDGAPQASER